MTGFRPMDIIQAVLKGVETIRMIRERRAKYVRNRNRLLLISSSGVLPGRRMGNISSSSARSPGNSRVSHHPAPR